MIWGQSSAWQDRLVTAWLIQKMGQEFTSMERGERWDPRAPDAPNTSQALHSWDCLESQWNDKTLYQAWKHQQMTMPVLPEHTRSAQGPDTHFFGRHKHHIKRAKAKVNLQGEISAYQQQGDVECYSAAWGPAELSETLAQAYLYAEEANRAEHFVIASGLQNQTWVYRPGHDGKLHLVDEEPWVHQQGLSRLPPSRSVTLASANKRTTEAQGWPGGEPPEPDLEKLGDEPVPYIPVRPEIKNPDDPEFDIRCEGFAAAEVQDDSVFDPDSRLNYLEIPEHLRDRQGARLRQRDNRKPRHQQWIKKLGPARTRKLAEQWRSKLARKGREALEQDLIPEASRSKASKQIKRLRALAKRGLGKKGCPAAKKGGRSPAPAPLPAPEAPPEETDVLQHPLHSKAVLLVAESCPWPQWGREGTITKVTATSQGQLTCHFLADGVPAFFFRGPPESFERPSAATYASPSPASFDYRTADAASSVHRARDVILGADHPGTLPNLQHGEFLDIQAMGAAIMEIEGRVPVANSMLLLPAVCLQLAWPGDLDSSQERQLSDLRADMASCQVVWLVLWAPNHYTVLEARRPGADAPWTLLLWDSLLGDHAPSALMTSTIAPRLFLMEAPDNSCSPARSQRDSWSCWAHALIRLECRRRCARNEKPQPPLSFRDLIKRGNDFLARVRGAAAPQAPSARKRGTRLPTAPPAKAARPKPRNWDPTNDPQTWADAKIRAEVCSKCRPRAAGPGLQTFKGCSD